MTNNYGEEEVSKMNPDYSDRIYVTASVEDQCILIAQNWKMKEEGKIKNTKVNILKMAAHMNQRANSFEKIVDNIPNDMMDFEDPSTPFILQVLLSL